jgi:hypothetical protein
VTPVLTLILAASIDPLSARDCAEVFGDEADVGANRRARESRLNFVIDSGAQVVVDHSFAWSEPTETEIRSLSLVETSTATALVYFTASEEEIDCPDAFYRISPDDSLGPEGRIVAVLRRGLLIELGEDLYHLPSDGEASPDFRLTWSSRFGIRRPSTPSKPTVTRRRK